MNLSDHAEKLLREHYMLPEEKNPRDVMIRAASTFCGGDTELRDRLISYTDQKWFMYSSPILSNAGTRSMPISCFLSYVPDSITGLIQHESEIRHLSILGGGIGTHWSSVRSIGQETKHGARTPGIIPFLHCTDSAMLAYHQGQTRRGSAAAYLDVSHPEILEFITMRTPKGDSNRVNLNLHHGVNISQRFMDAVVQGTEFPLVDPHSGIVTKYVDARELWSLLIKTRYQTGEPYLHWIDKSNAALNPALHQKGYRVRGSNLCAEIVLPTGPDYTAVCCLSSLNLEYYGEWEHTRIVEDVTEMLDNVLEYFIARAPESVRNAVRSAQYERSIGIGAMGFHSLLQRRGIPFESAQAVSLNKRIFREIKLRAYEHSCNLAKVRGEPEGLAGTGQRNAHLLAIAPNSNNSILLDTSPSIEPWKANCFEHTTRIGSIFKKNSYLEATLGSLGMNTPEVWKSIMQNEGSVQHLDIPEWDKLVYKTANEIDQHWVVQHAADRQEYVCQAQSLNLFFPAAADVNYVQSVHLKAAMSPVKTLYYLRTDGKKSESIDLKIIRNPLQDCIACEG
jgi:ribonucleoside-diphosphate reductase alpha chain